MYSIIFFLRCSFSISRNKSLVSATCFPLPVQLELADQLDPGAGPHHVVGRAVHVVRRLLGHHELEFSFIVDCDRLIGLTRGTQVLYRGKY